METQNAAPIPNEVPVNPAVPKPKRAKLIVGVVTLIVLLGSAAFVGGRLLNQPTQAADSGGITLNGGPGGAQSFSLQLERAQELPEAAPDVAGLFAERKDNSVFVTMGDKITVAVSKDGSVDTQTDGNGQKLEVVVTGETTVYKDVTEPPEIKASPSDGKVYQKVAPGSLDEIGSNSFVSAWGERRGDRVIAKVLMYSPAFRIKAPAP